MMGLTPAALACDQKSKEPKLLPWSVTAIAGMPCAATSFMRSVTRAAPSSMLYSLCTCRCTKESLVTPSPSGVGPGPGPSSRLIRAEDVEGVLEVVGVACLELHVLPRGRMPESELDRVQPLPREFQAR